MSADKLDHMEYARRAVAWLEARNNEHARCDGLIPLASCELQQSADVAPDDEDAALWARCGRILRERDPETYAQLRTAALSFAVLAHEPIPPNEN